jgi:hypothetical protein
MTINLYRSLIVLVCMATSHSYASMTSAPEEIDVLVVDAKTHEGLQAARVFVLDETGKENAAAKTDKLGRVTLHVTLPAGSAPRFLLAEHSTHFITGVRWVPGLREYYLHATVFVVR